MTHLGPEPDFTSDVPGMAMWGWMSPIELTWLRETASQMDSVCEIGSLHGRSAFALLTGCPGPVYCIDPWNDVHNKSLPSFLSHCGHFPNVRPVQGYSYDVKGAIPEVDMVFIDGDHHAESVLVDLQWYYPKARKLICGHDYYDTPDWSVKTVVDQFFGVPVIHVPDTGIWAVWL